MMVIILAAGLSERLRAVTGGQPKPLMKIAGKTLLERTVVSCTKYDITDFIIVAGYKHHLVEIALLQLSQNMS